MRVLTKLVLKNKLKIDNIDKTDNPLANTPPRYKKLLLWLNNALKEKEANTAAVLTNAILITLVIYFLNITRYENQ